MVRKYLPAVIFSALVAACNLHLLSQRPPDLLVFDRTAALGGQWWRLLTHPLVHVSLYHLALDVAAVAILWRLLPLSTRAKTCAACICGIASLAWAAAFSPLIGQTGLCGLSGIAHGLMVVCGVLALFTAVGGRKDLRAGLLGAVLCAAGLGKSLFEVASGGALFSGLHGGGLGVPIVEAHLGGALGGLGVGLFLVFSGFSHGIRNKTL